MRLQTTLLGLLGAAALVLNGASASIRANGAEFFEAQNDGKLVLYYAGNIKDSKGNPLDKVTVTIKVKNADLTFPFRNDSPGHFRSPDVGRSVEAAGKTVDPAQIEITVTKKDYKLVRAPKIPNKLGAVTLDAFVLDPM